MDSNNCTNIKIAQHTNQKLILSFKKELMKIIIQDNKTINIKPLRKSANHQKK